MKRNNKDYLVGLGMSYTILLFIASLALIFM